MKKKILLTTILILLIIPLLNAGLIINSPLTNKSVYNQINTTLNFTTNSHNNTVWYTLDSGTTNKTLCFSTSNECISNQSELIFPNQGYFNLTIYANDSSGNEIQNTSENIFVGQNIILQKENIISDIYANDNDNSTFISLWNITDLNKRIGIRIANDMSSILNLYLVAKAGTIDTDTTINRITNITWTEAINESQISDFLTTNETTTENFSSIASGSFTKIDITNIIATDTTIRNQSSFYIYDPDRPVSLNSINSVVDDSGYLFSNLLVNGLKFIDKEDSSSTGNTPYLNITYYSNNSYPNIYHLTNNNFNFTNSNINISYNVTDDNSLLNISFYLDSQLNSSQYDISRGVKNNFSLSLSDGDYTYFIRSKDSDGLINDTEEQTITVDTKVDTVIIVKPEDLEEFSYNTSLELNTTVIDLGVGLDTCQYEVVNSTSQIIPNTTLTCGTNTTIDVPNGINTVTFCANDTVGNLKCDTNSFTISLQAPAINLDFPKNGVYINNGTNLYINYTATDSNGLGTVQVWHDFNGSFSLNLSRTDVVSGVQSFNQYNITDGTYKYNIFANDTGGNGRFASNNFSFTIDTIYPEITNISIETNSGSQTVTFNSTLTEINSNNCFYSVLDSNGTTEISNTTYTCYQNDTQFIVSDFGTYNLYIYANDSAGNLNFSNNSFTTSVSGGGTSGGGGSAESVDIEELKKQLGIEQSIFSTNFSAESVGGGNTLSLFLAKDSVKPRTKKLYLNNNLLNPITIELSCINVNESTSEGIDICNYLTLSENKVVLPPTTQDRIEVELKFKTPPNSSYGEEYFANIVLVRTDVENSSLVQFSKIDVKGRVSILAQIFKWNYYGEADEEGNRKSYPIWIPSLVISLILSAIFIGILFWRKLFLIGWFGGVVMFLFLFLFNLYVIF